MSVTKYCLLLLLTGLTGLFQGISSRNLTHCYKCDRVTDMNDCKAIETCQLDEVDDDLPTPPMPSIHYFRYKSLLLNWVEPLTTCKALHMKNSTKTKVELAEVCGVTTEASSTGSNGSHTYSAGCQRKPLCIEATKRIIKYRAMFSVGRRTTMPACIVCCGGSFCNNMDCVGLLDKLFALYQTGHLDLNTLERIP